MEHKIFLSREDITLIKLADLRNIIIIIYITLFYFHSSNYSTFFFCFL